MRRFLSPIILSVSNSARSLAEEWNAFWYQPADPTLLGVIRILTGLMLLYTHAVWGLVLAQFFGPASWLSAGLVRAIQQDQYTYSFWWLVPDALDVARLWIVDGRPAAVYSRPLDALDLDPVVRGRGLVCPPRARGDVWPRPDQRHAELVPGHRPQRPGAVARPRDRQTGDEGQPRLGPPPARVPTWPCA